MREQNTRAQECAAALRQALHEYREASGFWSEHCDKTLLDLIEALRIRAAEPVEREER